MPWGNLGMPGVAVNVQGHKNTDFQVNSATGRRQSAWKQAFYAILTKRVGSRPLKMPYG